MTGSSHRLLSRGRDAALLVTDTGRIRIEAQPGRAAHVRRCSELHEGALPPLVRTVARGEDWAEFEPKFGLSFPALISTIKAGELPRLPYPVATAFIELVMDALETAHAAGHYFHTMGPANVIISAEGGIAFLGLGGLELSSTVFCTPEIGLGEAPSVGADMFAAGQVLRTALPAVDLPAALRRLYGGRPENEESRFWRQLNRIERALASVSPDSRRIEIKYVRRVYRTFWKFVGVQPDPDALRRFAAEAQTILEETVPSAVYDARADTLHLADGRRVELASRPVQARLLAVLIQAHVDEECGGLDTDGLIERVWPGEQILQDSARNRLYVAISKLRKAGLEPYLGRDHEGRYRLAEELRIELRRVH